MKHSDLPPLNSLWQHTKSGNVYMVTDWLNTSVDQTDKYPWMIGYYNLDADTSWARRADDWHRSFICLNPPIPDPRP